MRKLISIILFFLAFQVSSQKIRDISDDNRGYQMVGLEEAGILMNEGKNAEAEVILKKISDDLLSEGSIRDGLEVKYVYGKSVMHQWKTNDALQVYKEVLDQARDEKILDLYGNSMHACINILQFKNEHDKAKILCLEAMKIEGLLPSDLSDIYNYYSICLETEEKLDSALIYAKMAFAIDSTLQDTISLPATNMHIADLYKQQEKYTLAIKHYLQAEATLPKTGKYHYKLAMLYGQWASLMLDIANLERAEHYNDKAIEICEINKLKSHYSKMLTQKAIILSMDGRCAEALEYFDKAALQNKKVKSKSSWSRNIVAKINCQIDLGIDIDQSEMDSLLRVKPQVKFKSIRSNIDYVNLKLKASSNLSNNLFENAFNKILADLSGGKYLISKRNLHQLRYKFYQDKSDFKASNEALEKYIALVEEIGKQEADFKTVELELVYDQEQKRKEIRDLADTTSVQALKLKQQNQAILFGGIAFLFIATLLFFIFRLYQKVKYQNTQVSKALDEKEFLLKEIHHRVKNNLQVISSLLSLQSRQIKDPETKQAISEGRSRVRSMALIHQNLYQNDDLSAIAVKPYLEKLAEELFSTYKIDENQINLQLNIDDLILDIDTMVPLGLILNELVSNSLKHAFPGNEKGLITINLREQNKQLLLEVRDNGVGADWDQLNSNKSFGNRLLRSLSKKLKANLEFKNENGTVAYMNISNYSKSASQKAS